MAIGYTAAPPVRPRRRRRAAAPFFIRSVHIHALFGHIHYNSLDLVSSEESAARLSVLFGDNGAGKTTLLNLIYSALSPESGVGLRGYIAQTPFEKFGIDFSDGSFVAITKLKDLTGSFRYIYKSSSFEMDVVMVADDENEVSVQESTHELEQTLRRIDLDVLFVDHERSVRSTYRFLSELKVETSSVWDDLRFQTVSLAAGKQWRKNRDRSLQFPLTGMVDAVNQMFRSEAFRQGNMGEEGASSVYLEITRALIRPKKRGRPSPEEERRGMDEILEELENSTNSYVRHGLLSNYPFQDLRAIYQAASRPKKMNISDVLTPFVTSIQRRVNALGSLHDLLTSFEVELNRYLSGKTASVHVLHGLIISDANGPINLKSLSSGEKQLVFLLCAAVVSRGSRSLILIDEPELSLNYKWQRMIAGSLARLSSSATTQFIMASHSIEIISRYGDSAIELKNDASKAHG